MLRIYFFALFFVLVAQCGQGGDGENNIVPPSATPIDKDRLLVENIAVGYLWPEVQAFQDATAVLAIRAEQACSTDQGLPLDEIWADWHRAMMIYHRLELLAFGPLGEDPPANCKGQGALACRMYSWLSTRPKGIRREIRESQELNNYELSNSPGVVGLDALEYILFDELGRDRLTLSAQDESCLYVQLLAEDLAQNALVLERDYDKDVVQKILVDPEDFDRPNYRSFLQDIVVSLRFLEHDILYKKINRPLGLFSKEEIFSCLEGDDCGEFLEHPYAELGQEALEENLQAFDKVFQGAGDSFGIYDYLIESEKDREAGRAQSMVKSFQRRLSKLPRGDKLKASLNGVGAKGCRPGQFCHIQSSAKQLSDWAKGPLIQLLSDGLPAGVQGDND